MTRTFATLMWLWVAAFPGFVSHREVSAPIFMLSTWPDAATLVEVAGLPRDAVLPDGQILPAGYEAQKNWQTNRWDISPWLP